MILSQPSKVADPLSDALACLGARGLRLTRLRASGRWALAFPAMPRLKFVTVVRGAAWVRMADRAPVQLKAGDVCVIGSGGYQVGSDLSVRPVDGLALYRQSADGTVALGGDGSDGSETLMLGGAVAFASDQAAFLLDGLPPLLAIARGSPGAVNVGRLLEVLADEAPDTRPGGPVLAARLAEVLVIEAIRAYLESGAAADTGWIAALADPQIGKALRLMHGDIAAPWTVAQLAREVGLSRSAFALRFADRVGRPPLDYLRHWRMLVARQALGTAGADIAGVAAQVGYASQSAFGHAFKRTFGHAPGRLS